MTRIERLLTAMAQVDGAVVLRRDMTVVGFGGEIAGVGPASPFQAVAVKTAPDEPASDERPLASFGMRHRSAIRFVEQVRGSFALVVSQDGDVRVLAHDRGAAVVYDGATPEDWVVAR